VVAEDRFEPKLAVANEVKLDLVGVNCKVLVEVAWEALAGIGEVKGPVSGKFVVGLAMVDDEIACNAWEELDLVGMTLVEEARTAAFWGVRGPVAFGGKIVVVAGLDDEIACTNAPGGKFVVGLAMVDDKIASNALELAAEGE
jgi:hypothetical protein